MAESALDELNAALARRAPAIAGMLVDRATHELLAVDLEAADAVESRVEAAGYRRVRSGDWFL